MHNTGERNLTIQLNVTPEEKAKLLEASKRRSIPLGTWCRMVCIEAAVCEAEKGGGKS